MNHQVDLVELEPDDLKQVAGRVWSNGERSGWVGIRFEIDNRDCVLESVANGWFVDAVLASRSVDLHIEQYRNT